MSRSFRRVLTFAIGFVTVVAAGPALASVQASNEQKGLNAINHIVVIYEENHSFDNLYGGWEGVNGLAAADAAHTTQVIQSNTSPPPAYTCLMQNDVNLVSHPGGRADVSAAGCLCPERASAERWQPARRLHSRHSPPLLPGAVPAEQWESEPLRDRKRRRRPRDGLLQHDRPADLCIPAQ
ncbi:MAG: hypothetical protein E6H99_15305 [Chloroflexi bacterium]|nr:MAG: hypothetical protein E6H99_15305 [Chloroflexota bacterium]